MSKNLRVFLLSALVVILGVTSAFAESWGVSFDVSSADVIDFTYTSLDTIKLVGGTTVTLRLNATTGDVDVSSLKISASDGKAATLIITGNTSVKANLFLSTEHSSWDIGDNAIVSIDVPIKAADSLGSFDVTIGSKARLAFGSGAGVYSGGSTTANGFTTANVSFDVKGGTLDVLNTNVFKSNTINKITLAGTLVTDQANIANLSAGSLVISRDSAVIDPVGDISLTKAVLSGDGTLTKRGGGAFTFASGDTVPGSVDLIVTEGTLTLVKGAYKPTGAGYLTVSGDSAELVLETGAIVLEPTANVSFDVHKGTLTLADKAIKSTSTDIYPGDDYGPLYSLTLNQKSIDITVSKDAKVVLNGVQDVRTIKGIGNVEINDGTLILLSSDSLGALTISGTNADVALYSGDYEASMFKSADLSGVANLVVYGGATLYVASSDVISADTIWLRSDRPNDAGTTPVLSFMVGSLALSPDVVLDNIKVDATTNKDGVAMITGLSDDAATIAKVTLYANVEADGLDFSTATEAVHALKLSGDIIWDGENTAGDGSSYTSADILIANSADVELLGAKPLGTGNDLIVGAGTHLTVANGATLGGNVTFEAGVISDDNEVSYDLAVTSREITVFETTVGSENRTEGTYAVTVAKKLTLPTDRAVGIVVKDDGDAFTNATSTFGMRFKVIGSTTTAKAGNYYIVSPDSEVMALARLTTEDTNGIVLESQTEYLVLGLDGTYEFTAGSADFGAGLPFTINVPYTLTYGGNTVFTTKGTSGTRNGHRYIAGITKFDTDSTDLGSLKITISDGTTTTNNGVFSNNDVVLQAEPSYASSATTSADNYIKISGTSYAKSVKLTISIEWDTTDNAALTTASNTYTFTGKGSDSQTDDGEEIGQMETEAVGDVTFTAGDPSADVKFKVDGMRKPTYTTTSRAYLDGNVYKWRVMAVEGSYMMKDSEGNWVEVSDITLKVVTDNDSANPVEVPSSDLTITADGAESVIVAVSLDKLGTTNNKFSATKTLSLVGETTDGEKIVTEPVDFTLLAAELTEVSQTISADTLNQTIALGDTTSTQKVFDINPDVLSGDIHFLVDDLPAWLGWNGSGSTLSYTIDTTQLPAAGVYPFTVIAYSGAADINSPRVAFTFTVTVTDGTTPPVESVEPAISADKTTVTVTLPDGTDTVTFTLIGGAADLAIEENTNPEGLVTLSGSVATINAAGVSAGTYTYTFTATSADAFTLTVTVNPAPAVAFDIEEVDTDHDFSSAVDGHTYYMTFRAVGATGAVTWELSDTNEDGDTFTFNGELHSAMSGDLFVVEGTAVTGEEQGFVVKATSGTETVYDEVTFDVEADEVTEYTELDATEGSHSAVAAGYRVMFPEGVAAEEDAVFLPIWLKPVFGTGDFEDMVVGVEFAGTVGTLSNDTTAKVRVEATDANNDDADVFYGWDVTYAAATTPDVPGTTSPDQPGTTSPDQPGTTSPDQPGTTSPDQPGTTTFSLNTRFSSRTIDIADSPVSFDIAAVVSPVNNLGTVTYTASVRPATGLTVNVDNTAGRVVLTATTAGAYTVTITGTDSGRTTGNIATATITVTVTSSGNPGSSGGGCDAGFGALALALAAPLFLRRRRS